MDFTPNGIVQTNLFVNSRFFFLQFHLALQQPVLLPQLLPNALQFLYRFPNIRNILIPEYVSASNFRSRQTKFIKVNGTNQRLQQRFFVEHPSPFGPVDNIQLRIRNLGSHRGISEQHGVVAVGRDNGERNAELPSRQYHYRQCGRHIPRKPIDEAHLPNIEDGISNHHQNRQECNTVSPSQLTSVSP